MSVQLCVDFMIVPGADPARKFRGAIRIMFGSQVSWWLRYCKRDQVYLTALLWQNNGQRNSECCFPNCKKSWWIKLISWVLGGLSPKSQLPWIGRTCVQTNRSQTNRNIFPMSRLKCLASDVDVSAYFLLSWLTQVFHNAAKNPVREILRVHVRITGVERERVLRRLRVSCRQRWKGGFAWNIFFEKTNFRCNGNGSGPSHVQRRRPMRRK